MIYFIKPGSVAAVVSDTGECVQVMSEAGDGAREGFCRLDDFSSAFYKARA